MASKLKVQPQNPLMRNVCLETWADGLILSLTSSVAMGEAIHLPTSIVFMG